jgi:hypothetical protein
MTSKALQFPHKKIRAQVIADFVRIAGYRGVVVFTCGNAAKTLRDEGLEVTEVGPRGDLKTEKWWTMAEIHRAWPDLFDATSGHLPIPLMGDIAKAYRAHLGELRVGRYSVPSGSGETVTCLRVAYPLLEFDPTYDEAKLETTRHDDAPLNLFVDADSIPGSDEDKKKTAHLMEKYGGHVTALPPRAGTKARRGSLVPGLVLLAVVAGLSSLITLFIVIR